MTDSPYYFRPIRMNTVGYLKAYGAENAMITPLKNEKMFVSKLSGPMTTTDTTLNRVIDALSSVGILATTKEMALDDVIAQSSSNYATEDNAADRLINKCMLTRYLAQLDSQPPSSSSQPLFGLYEPDLLTNTGSADIGSNSFNTCEFDSERGVLQKMVNDWDLLFSDDTVTALQFISAYDTLERSSQQEEGGDTVANRSTGLIQLPDYNQYYR